jgi:arsenite methyltransferase
MDLIAYLLIACLDPHEFLVRSPHPWAPPLSRILAERFSTEERELFETIFRPRVEARQFVTADRIAYLTALKPPS